jgi:hypothetical protein
LHTNNNYFMKKIDQSISKDYPPVKLYFEDLVEIELVLNKISTEFQIQAADYSFDSIEELVTNIGKRELAEMEIRTINPYVSISFKRFYTRLYVASSEFDSAGLFYKLDYILKRTRRRLWFLYSNYSIWALFIISVTSSLTSLSINLSFMSIPFGKTASTALSLFGCACAALLIWITYITNHHSTIFLISRYTQGSFWIRKKDDILLAIISAIFGAILYVIVTSLF